jgi:hypothetical protein
MGNDDKRIDCVKCKGKGGKVVYGNPKTGKKRLPENEVGMYWWEKCKKCRY